MLKCDTSKLALKVWPLNKGNLEGFDVCLNDRFVRSAMAEEANVETEVVLFKDLDRKEKEIVLYLPCHQEVLIRAVGADEDTKFAVPEHNFALPLPLLFYGSSVCEGNGALKPGMTYPAKLCRDLDLDFVNLGFGEQDELSKDGVHPTDYGYSIIAGKLLPITRKALGL